MILSVVGILIIATAVIFSSSGNYGVLKGTFISSERPFATMVFDLDDHQTFYLYDRDKTDIGSYEKRTDSTYLINSSNFTDHEITFDQKNGITIDMDNQNYVFTRESDAPTVINDNR